MYGIFDCKTKWVICSLHQHRRDSEYYVLDKPQESYCVFKCDSSISRTSYYEGKSTKKNTVHLISEAKYNLIITECEKIMKAKSLIAITISALVGSLPKPKIDEEITGVEFE